MIRNIIWKIHNIFLKIFSIRTLGVRALVIKDQEVLLITHTYVPNWYAIGGGIEKGETALESIKRELLEEVGISLTKEPFLAGIYHNTISKPDDYVVLYIVKDFTQAKVHSSEIKKTKWFPLNNIPKNTSEGTKRRIEEYLGLREANGKW